jgi:hypothetical protein
MGVRAHNKLRKNEGAEVPCGEGSQNGTEADKLEILPEIQQDLDLVADSLRIIACPRYRTFSRFCLVTPNAAFHCGLHGLAAREHITIIYIVLVAASTAAGSDGLVLPCLLQIRGTSAAFRQIFRSLDFPD